MTRRIVVTQGICSVSREEDALMTTVLGSCVATCLHDTAAGIGGMNHFLLSDQEGAADGRAIYGVHAMELLINAMMREGADRRRLRAHIYGGAAVVPGIARDIGAANADFARAYLRAESIEIVRDDTGGRRARRVEFQPAAGRARRVFVEDQPVPIAMRSVPVSNDVEIF